MIYLNNPSPIKVTKVVFASHMVQVLNKLQIITNWDLVSKLDHLVRAINVSWDAHLFADEQK